MPRAEDSEALTVLVKKGDKRRITNHAKLRQLSLSDYIRSLVEADMGEQLQPMEHGGDRRERKSSGEHSA